jgi:hypothetical protein
MPRAVILLACLIVAEVYPAAGTQQSSVLALDVSTRARFLRPGDTSVMKVLPPVQSTYHEMLHSISLLILFRVIISIATE